MSEIHDPRKEEMDPNWEDERMKEAAKAVGEQLVNAAEKANQPLPEIERPEEAREYVESIDPEELAKKILENRDSGKD